MPNKILSAIPATLLPLSVIGAAEVVRAQNEETALLRRDSLISIAREIVETRRYCTPR